jgi:hypothetical protein
MASALKAVVGNTAPQYQITCERPDGTIINLTSCSVALFLYLNKVQQNIGHETSTITVLAPATAGIIGWQPAAGDFNQKGNYKANIIVTYVDSSVETLYNQALFSIRNLVQ